MTENSLWISALVTPGHQIASGKNPNTPYPKGSIKLQWPFLQRSPLDLQDLSSAGTLNIDLRPYEFVPNSPETTITAQWFQKITETFLFFPIKIRYQAKLYKGYVYYPSPDTKPDHFKPPYHIDLLLPWIENISYGDRIEILLPKDNIKKAA